MGALGLFKKNTREAALRTPPMSSPKSHTTRIPHGNKRALCDHPHVQTVLVRLEKRKLDNSINGEAYRTAKIQILAGLDLALRSKVTMEQSLFDMQDWVQANTMALPFEPIHDVAKHLGEAYTKVQSCQPKFSRRCRGA